MTGYDSKRAAARDKLVVTDIDGHVVRDARKPKKAQRTWVSLTDDEVGDLSDFAYNNDEEFVRNVEAKLKELNNG